MNRGRPTTRPSDRYPGWGISATDCIELSMVEPGSDRADALLAQIERQAADCRVIHRRAFERRVMEEEASKKRRRHKSASSAQRRREAAVALPPAGPVSHPRSYSPCVESDASLSRTRKPSAVGTGVITSDPPPASSSVGGARP